MSTSITTIQSTDLITNSRADINNNFDSLLVNKIETSVLDTDTSLAANSDAKIATQKAVKAYVDAGGNVNASTTVKGIVEEADSTETNAGTATGATGARLYVNPSNLAGYVTSAGILSKVSSGVASYDLTTASGTQNIAHGLGVSPKIVKITAMWSNEATGASGASTSHAYTVYSGGVQSSAYVSHQSTSSSSSNDSEHGNVFRIVDTAHNSNYQSGSLSVDATNIAISWTKTGTPAGTAYLVWEAYA